MTPPELRHLVLLPQDAEVPDEKPYVDNDPQKDPDYSMWGSEPAGLQYQGFIPYLINLTRKSTKISKPQKKISKPH